MRNPKAYHKENTHRAGRLPESRTLLPGLQSLKEYNRVRCAGTLPDSWSSLASVQRLEMAYNRITGLHPRLLADLSTPGDPVGSE